MTVPARFRGGTLYDRLAHLRDRFFSNPRFQRWAAGSWLMRFVARRRSTALFDLCAGFVYSQILVAASRLELFARLAEGPLETKELAEQVDLPPARMRVLLDACVALRLLERRGKDRWGLGVLGSPLLGNPSVASMLQHHELLYRDLRDPVALLRDPSPDTELRRYWGYACSANPDALSMEAVAPYSNLMAETQALIAEDVLDALGPLRARSWLDVGGGDGAFLQALGRRVPELDLRLLDLPAVAAMARARLSAHPDFEATGGDMFRDRWPSAEVVSLVRVLHDHDDPALDRLLAHAYAQMAPRSRLVVAEPMKDAPGHPRVGAAYFGCYLLAMGQGRPRTRREIIRALKGAGFQQVRSVRTRRPMLTQLVRAERP